MQQAPTEPRSCGITRPHDPHGWTVDRYPTAAPGTPAHCPGLEADPTNLSHSHLAATALENINRAERVAYDLDERGAIDTAAQILAACATARATLAAAVRPNP